MKARLGNAEGITATAHKVARIIYALITQEKTYDEETVKKMPERTRNRRIYNLHRQAEKLGLKLVPS